MDYHLAIDLGASSGRCIVGYKKGAKIKAEEIHRFRGYLKTTEDGLVWDIDYVFAEIKKGISLALKWYPDLKTLAIDSRGVDYCLVKNDSLITPVYAY